MTTGTARQRRGLLLYSSVLTALAIVVSLLVFPSRARAVEAVRIMPLGDSITEGKVGEATYRYFLWHDLFGAGRAVDFVGSLIGVKGGEPKYADFDQDHEGHSGNRADQIA
ncbi:MAG: hypothetical protein Q8Q52_07440 [Acidimicrobiia bacterium]|nr:hypothetical protein [Acidimicrobiia bacterium]